MEPTKRLRARILGGAAALFTAASLEAAPSIAGHVVVAGLTRLEEGVVGLYRGLGFGPALLRLEDVRARVAMDLGLASTEGMDPNAPLGSVWLEDGDALLRVPFLTAADGAALRAGVDSGVRLVSVEGCRFFVVAPDETVGRAVAEYLRVSVSERSVDEATVAFRFVAAPFVQRVDAWLGMRAELLRGVDRVASLLGEGREDLRRTAEALDLFREAVVPWELVDGDVTIDAAGIALDLRLAASHGSTAARWLDEAEPLAPSAAARRPGIAACAEWSGSTDAARELLAWLSPVAGAPALRFETIAGGGRLLVPFDAGSLPVPEGDVAALVRLSVACDALRGHDAATSPIHGIATAEDGALRVAVRAPIEQLRACVPRIEVR